MTGKDYIRIPFLLGVLVGTLLFLAACSTDEAASTADTPSTDTAPQTMLLTVPNVPDQWTYVSLVSGSVVGTCAMSDSTAQREWAQRTDWDLALGNGHIRTNSGLSGRATEGIASSPSPFEAVRPNLATDLAPDTTHVSIW